MVEVILWFVVVDLLAAVGLSQYAFNRERKLVIDILDKLKPVLTDILDS